MFQYAPYIWGFKVLSYLGLDYPFIVVFYFKIATLECLDHG